MKEILRLNSDLLKNSNISLLELDWKFFFETCDYWQQYPPDIIIGADLLYSEEDFEYLFATISFLFEMSPNPMKFVTAYHERR